VRDSLQGTEQYFELNKFDHWLLKVPLYSMLTFAYLAFSKNNFTKNILACLYLHQKKLYGNENANVRN